MRSFLIYLTCLFSVHLCSAQLEKIVYEDGSYAVGKLIDGKKEGNWKTYHKNGKLFISSEYVSDTLHGKVVSWYYSGTKKAENDYKQGKLEGFSYTYNPNGQLLKKVTYKNNKQEGLCEIYKNGKLYSSYLLTPKGKITDQKFYDTKGNRIKKTKKGTFYK